MHVNDYDQVARLMTEVASLQGRVLSIETLPLELNTPNRSSTGPQDAYTPLECVMGLDTADLERVVRLAIIKELQSRHADCIKQLKALGVVFEKPKKEAQPTAEQPAQEGQNVIELRPPASGKRRKTNRSKKAAA